MQHGTGNYRSILGKYLCFFSGITLFPSAMACYINTLQTNTRTYTIHATISTQYNKTVHTDTPCSSMRLRALCCCKKPTLLPQVITPHVLADHPERHAFELGVGDGSSRRSAPGGKRPRARPSPQGTFARARPGRRAGAVVFSASEGGPTRPGTALSEPLTEATPSLSSSSSPVSDVPPPSDLKPQATCNSTAHSLAMPSFRWHGERNR